MENTRTSKGFQEKGVLGFQILFIFQQKWNKFGHFGHLPFQRDPKGNFSFYFLGTDILCLKG